MPLHSTIDPTSSDFARNAEAMLGLVTELREKLGVVAGGGGKTSRARHTSRGKMLARQRVDLLVDPGTAFLELSPLAAFGPYGGPAALGPVINTDVLRNMIAVGEGTMIARDEGLYNIWGIGIQDFPGCLLSGLMVRNNTVPSINAIYNTDGVNGISANVVEQNQAYWQPTFPTPGFLIQDNSPPPS